MLNKQKTTLQELISAIGDAGGVSLSDSADKFPDGYTVYPLSSTGLFFGVPDTATPKQQLEVREQVVQMLESVEHFDELSRKYKLIKRDFRSIAESSGQQDFEKLLCSNLMHFLGDTEQYGVLNGEEVVISKQLSQHTIQIARLKLLKSDEYSVKVSTGELYVCQYQNYIVVVERATPLSCTEKNHIKLTLRYISLLQMQHSIGHAMSMLAERNSDSGAALLQGTEYLQECIDNLVKEANVDPLTLAYNRRYATRYVKDLYARNVRFSVVLIDIDHFKQVNDTCGHDIGDDVLRELVELFKLNCRDTDVVSRWGGEEFLIVLNEMDLESSVKKAELLREQIASKEFKSQVKITASFGVSVSSSLPVEDLNMLVRLVDKALYKAKQTGRNRVEFHSIP
ncbi:GGDEF domain-containing protein [Vibrio hannami]|uniref:GGDEF domain-containing protein n=1 Tax=Vibrio hannami TaxID=2717094 RepID=UPI00240F1AF0|nr:GGDEF domain-containing protein [Vibrio hannami]MDG3086099.1 GGDEF domain-containing protein [Vibrio hannami]